MIRLSISEWDERCDWLQAIAEHDVVWSIWAGDCGELSCAQLNGEWQFRAKYHKLKDAFLVCPPDWAPGPLLLRDNRSLPLRGCGTVLYSSCGFSSSDCRCFQVSNPCRAIHSTVSVHHTALTDSDFLITIASCCEIFMILFDFYWYLSLDSFPSKVGARSRGEKIKTFVDGLYSWCADNCCKQTILVQLIVEDVVVCFFNTVYVGAALSVGLHMFALT